MTQSDSTVPAETDAERLARVRRTPFGRLTEDEIALLDPEGQKRVRNFLAQMAREKACPGHEAVGTGTRGPIPHPGKGGPQAMTPVDRWDAINRRYVFSKRQCGPNESVEKSPPPIRPWAEDVLVLLLLGVIAVSAVVLWVAFRG